MTETHEVKAGRTWQEQIEDMEKLADMVISGVTPSLFICGKPGVGKSHRIKRRFILKGLVNGVDYKLVKGCSSAVGIYKILQDNPDSTIVFDDCDSSFKDSKSVQILKAALDSYDERIVSWPSPYITDRGLKAEFTFRGSVIFISNLDAEKVNQIDPALMSRSFSMEIVMSNSDVMELIEDNIESIEPMAEMTVKMEVLNFLKSVVAELGDVDLRTFKKTLRLKEFAANWREMTVRFA